MTRLSVNINKVALIRNSRGGNLPNLRQFAMDCEEYGAQGITVHPRPDERHIRYSDIPILKEVVQTEFNIEGYPSEQFLEMVINNAPHQCTLVPDPPGVLTSSEGWNTIESQDFLKQVIQKLKDAGVRVSLFLDPVVEYVEAAKECGADRVEFYTGNYASNYTSNPEIAVKEHKEAAIAAEKIGIGVNAGHDLNLNNLKYYHETITNLKEVSIGHALVSDALYYGIKNTIHMYLAQLT